MIDPWYVRTRAPNALSRPVPPAAGAEAAGGGGGGGGGGRNEYGFGFKAFSAVDSLFEGGFVPRETGALVVRAVIREAEEEEEEGPLERCPRPPHHSYGNQPDIVSCSPNDL